jgi:hypothetical protein
MDINILHLRVIHLVENNLNGTLVVDGHQYASSLSDTLDGKQSEWHPGFNIEVTPPAPNEVQAPPKVSEPSYGSTYVLGL